jgi:glutathione synthase/RimK-type ligase-like ATP-grasp enzyme
MITNEKLGTAELLYNCAVSMGLQPVWLMRDNLFSISTPMGERYVYDAKSTVNSQLSSNLTRNKLTTRLVLEHKGLPGIAFLKPKNLAEAEQFLAKHSKIIVKPLVGSNSHDVHIVDTAKRLRELDVDTSGYILEKYIAGKELRYLVLNGKVIAVHESEYGESVSETRELKRISYPESEWDPELAALALKTAKILHLRYAAVDYLIGPQGQIHILEVNSSPGLKWFHAPTSGPVVDVAGLFLEAMLSDMSSESPSTPDKLVSYPTVAYS